MQKIPCEMKMKRKGGEEKEFLLRRCNLDDVDTIVALQKAVHDGMPDPDMFVETSADEFRESIEQDYCFCFMDGEVMAAMTLGVSGRVSYRNYGKYLGYDEEHLLRTASMDTSFVSPEYRGYGLQKFFFDIREQAAREDGCTEALTTIDPNNEYSLNNAYRSGYEETERMEIYGGLERSILRKVFA